MYDCLKSMVEILAIIPARGSSKGIPMKNLQKINGRPLIEYTIDAAKKSKLLDRILVSTDNKKIANTAKSLGIEVPFLRPKKISGHKATNFEVVDHALKFLQKNESYIPDMIILLQPTNPLRTEKMIDKGIRLLKNSKADTVVSVQTTKYHHYASFLKKGKFLKPFKTNFEDYRRRQTRPKLYYNTGDIFAFWNKTFKNFHSFYGKKIIPLVLSDKFTHIDIDTPFDVFICESIMKGKKWKLK